MSTCKQDVIHIQNEENKFPILKLRINAVVLFIILKHRFSYGLIKFEISLPRGQFNPQMDLFISLL
jgi:hypothetical protein